MPLNQGYTVESQIKGEDVSLPFRKLHHTDYNRLQEVSK